MSAAVCHSVFASTGKVEVLRREPPRLRGAEERGPGKVEVLRREGHSDDERESGAVMTREGQLDGSSRASA